MALALSLVEWEALYAEVPTLECQRKCGSFCGPICMSRTEWRRITDEIRHEPSATPLMVSLTCPLLLPGIGACSVYAIRPLICRLWGTVESMKCPWGCVPSRWLTDEEGKGLLMRAAALGA